MYDSLKSAISRLWWQLHCWRPGKMPGTLIWVWNAWGIHQLSLIIISLCYFLNLKRSHWQLFLKPMSIIIVSCSYLIFFSTYHGLSKKHSHRHQFGFFPGIFLGQVHKRSPSQGLLEADSMAGPWSWWSWNVPQVTAMIYYGIHGNLPLWHLPMVTMKYPINYGIHGIING